MSHAEMSSLVWPACFYICQQEALSTLILEIQKDKPKTFHRKHNTWREGSLKLNILIFPGNHFSTSGSYHLQKRGIIQLTVSLQNLNQRLASSREQLCRQCPKGAWEQRRSSGVVPCMASHYLGNLRKLSEHAQTCCRGLLELGC